MHGIIEVKSFVDAWQVKSDRKKAAQYANSLALVHVTLAIFTPSSDETVLKKLSGEEIIDGVTVGGERRCNRRSYRHWMALKRLNMATHRLDTKIRDQITEVYKEGLQYKLFLNR